MKNLITSVTFIMALIAFGFASAQPDNDATKKNDDSTASQVLNESNEYERGLQLKWDFDDDELSTDEKFEIAKKAIKDTIGSEFDKDIEVEIEGLSDEEKKEIIDALEEGFSINMGSDDIPAGALAIVIPVLLLTLGMPIIIVLVVLWFGHKKCRQKMEVINAYLQADREVPDQVLNAFDVGSKSSLRRGIMLVGLGLGIVAAFNGFGESEVAALGLIPFFIGLARLIYWFLEGRKA